MQMDISKYWPFSIVSDIPPDHILVLDTGKIMKRKDATPKNIGKGYTFVGEYPLLASKSIYRQLVRARDTNSPSFLPRNPMMKSHLPPELWEIISSNLPVKDIMNILSTKKILSKYRDDPAFWYALVERDYPFMMISSIRTPGKQEYMFLFEIQRQMKLLLPEYTLSNEVLICAAEVYSPNDDTSQMLVAWLRDGIRTKRPWAPKTKVIHIVDTLPKLWPSLTMADDLMRKDSYLIRILDEAYDVMWKAFKDLSILDDMRTHDIRLIAEIMLKVSGYVYSLSKLVNMNTDRMPWKVMEMYPEFIERLKKAYRYNAYGTVKEDYDSKLLKKVLKDLPVHHGQTGQIFINKISALKAYPPGWIPHIWTEALGTYIPRMMLYTLNIV